MPKAESQSTLNYIKRSKLTLILLLNVSLDLKGSYNSFNFSLKDKTSISWLHLWTRGWKIRVIKLAPCQLSNSCMS